MDNKISLATLFYLAVVFFSFVYAFLFGNLHLLFGETSPAPGSLMRGLLIGLAIVAVSHALFRLFRFAREASRAMSGFLGAMTPAEAVYLAAISGFAEELCFRGALWPHLGLAGTSILFGILHTVPVRALALYPVFAALAGVVFGSLRQSSGSIWPPVVAHATINAINLAFLGAMERRRPPPPPTPATAQEPLDPPLLLPEQIDIEDGTFPLTLWRYDLRVELDGTDRATMQECLEHENLALFACVAREDVYQQFAEGMFIFTESFPSPFAGFPRDIATISSYLFQPVIGIEVAERYTDSDVTDDVRAWKVVAQRGEWVKVPLLVESLEDGKFAIDQDNEDEEVLAAHWNEYPRWFQDGMRFKYPRLRDL